jgi:hypothetical protein
MHMPATDIDRRLLASQRLNALGGTVSVVPLYKVVIEGRRVETLVDESFAVWGFVATRWLRASGREAAEREGLALVWKELHARRSVLNSDAAPPELALEEISEANVMPAVQPGFVCYPEDHEAG